jgi:hypothetical protein
MDQEDGRTLPVVRVVDLEAPFRESGHNLPPVYDAQRVGLEPRSGGKRLLCGAPKRQRRCVRQQPLVIQTLLPASR